LFFGAPSPRLELIIPEMELVTSEPKVKNIFAAAREELADWLPTKRARFE
jgi:hypothetical protein